MTILFYHCVNISHQKFYTGLTFIYTKDFLQLVFLEVQVVRPTTLHNYAMSDLQEVSYKKDKGRHLVALV